MEKHAGRNLFTMLRMAMAVLFIMVLLSPGSAKAAGVVGSGIPDSCTETALDASLVDGGLITFNCGAGPITITLTTQKIIARDTTIDGGGKITLSGGDAIRLFYVSSNVSLTLNNLSISNGSDSPGGAIYNTGTLIITNSTLINNKAPGGVGGVIYNTGGVTITGSTLSNNVASAGLAGCISNEGMLTISNSTFSNNFGGLAGGAIINNGTTSIDHGIFYINQSPGGGGAIVNNNSLTILNSSFSNNTSSSGRGGAIYNVSTMTITGSGFSLNEASSSGGSIYNTSFITITNSIFSSNTVTSGVGGSIHNDASGDLVIRATTIKDGSIPGGMGGGIYNEGGLTLEADTLSGNSVPAGMGGGLYNGTSGIATVTNCTFAENGGGMAGGGIISNGVITVTNSTLYENYAGGLVNNGTMTVKNTIVAANTSYNCNGTIVSAGHNLEDGVTCGFTAEGDLSNTDPFMAPLANNGGLTLTYALLPNSPAINAGTNTGCPAVDQRGMSRPQFGVCDIGAFEFVINIFMPLLSK